MFDILENIAFYEANAKNKKPKKAKAVKKKRVSKEANSTFNAQGQAKPRMTKETNSTFSIASTRSKSSAKGPNEMPFDDLLPQEKTQARVAKDSDGNKKSGTGSDMSFGEDEEEKGDEFMDDSPKGSVSSE